MMQRLSIDSSSSASKLHSYGGGRQDDTYNHLNDSKRKETLSSPLPPPPSSSSPADYDDHDLKDVKLRRLSSLQSPYQKREKLIVHVIPVLTLICFIILYLSSHAPSQSDLAQFNGYMRQSKRLESEENGEISELMTISADALSIRSSIRKLRETETLPRRRTSHRKIADF